MGNISKNFDRIEFACKNRCGFRAVDKELVEVLQDVRDHFCGPVNIHSGCRCKEWNAVWSGNSSSEHINGIAADFDVKSISNDLVYDYLVKKYPDKYGLGKYATWIHIDVRKTKSRW